MSDALLAAVEGLLFVADKPLTPGELRQALGTSEASLPAVQHALGRLVERHAPAQGRGFYLARVGEAFQLRTTPDVALLVAPFTGRAPTKLSRAALETLAIVAYQQPCTRADVERVRGVESGGVLRALLDRKLLRIAGRRAEVGRPMMYGTSPEFLAQFGLAGLDELPNLREFTELGPEDLDGLPADALDADGRAQITLQEYASRRAIEHLDREVERRVAAAGGRGHEA